uniref:Cytochrome c oxidase subunit 2 n=1 Tax=Acropyga guianensis TaxID=602208 RepID=A0A6G5NIW5_9HYME|nr:cytochrome c oxidase subunit II [Acropyga guianensis]QBG38616.1 cytochrome c oxidase subunit II [Acropyga guianensis]
MNTWLISLQNSNSPSYDMMIFFHDFTMMILIFIMTLIFYIMFTLIINKFINRLILQNHFMEIIWTLIPMIILIFIAIPSIKILYITEEMYINKLTIKTLGHQWYWSYEYSDFLYIEFNSFMINSNNLSFNEFRLLDVDNRCIIPFNYPIRILSSSTDVIHAWTIPSLGIKMDSIPGRLNQSMMKMNRPGLFFGQCSEICGMNHSFMPIVLESTNFLNFKYWLNLMLN